MSIRDDILTALRQAYGTGPGLDGLTAEQLLARYDADREKSSRPAVDATPGLTARQARLLDAIRTHGGEWTTRRVQHLFAFTDPGEVQRYTARRDLEALHRAGHLVLIDDPDNWHYALHTRKGGA